MHNLNSIISYNLARLRQQKNLSLDGLAKLSGVSKAMIAQIERGAEGSRYAIYFLEKAAAAWPAEAEAVS